MFPISPTTRTLTSVALLGMLQGCADVDSRAPHVQREALPGGGALLTYASIPPGHEYPVVPDLRIGALEGSGPDVFGEVRALEVGRDGTIYVLDFQAAEVRAFASDGSYLRTLARRGQGPGELSRANGMAFAPDGTLWINEHGNRALIGLSPTGGELARHPMIVPGFGFVWTGVIDGNGVFWEHWSRPVNDVRPDMTATGLVEGATRAYYKSFDPRTQAYDSVMIGDFNYRSYRAAFQNGQMVMSLPFAPSPLSAADRFGRFWTARSDAYEIAGANSSGDTLVLLRIGEEAPPVTPDDVEEWRERMTAAFERVPALQLELERLIPEQKPILTRLMTDDEGRLWVGRTVPAGAAPLFDVFTAEGEFLASTRLFPGLSPGIPPIVRDGRIYAVVQDEFDVQYVLGAPLPVLGSGRPALGGAAQGAGGLQVGSGGG